MFLCYNSLILFIREGLQMTARNSDRFIIAYNRIEKAMEKLSGTNGHLPFSRLLDKSKK